MCWRLFDAVEMWGVLRHLKQFRKGPAGLRIYTNTLSLSRISRISRVSRPPHCLKSQLHPPELELFQNGRRMPSPCCPAGPAAEPWLVRDKLLGKNWRFVPWPSGPEEKPHAIDPATGVRPLAETDGEKSNETGG
jgi:hypothetical protein